MKKFLDRIARKSLITVLSPLPAAGIEIPRSLSKHLHFKGEISVRLSHGKSFRMQSHGHQIENNLYWYGKFGHEPETFIPWLLAAETAHVVLDIGANTGLYSLGAAAQNPSAVVYAFEPLPRVANLARENFRLNKNFRITVVENAVADVSSTVTLYDPGGDQPASASLRKDFISSNKSTILVNAIRIDDFVAEQKLDSVDLIKLDVEGVEELALRGMRETIAKFRPMLLLELGYQVGDLRPGGVFPHSLENSKGSERNLLFAMDIKKFEKMTASKY
jgi:FkbM family methyltransferase